MDQRLRDLERRAQLGEPEAIEALKRAQRRSGERFAFPKHLLSQWDEQFGKRKQGDHHRFMDELREVQGYLHWIANGDVEAEDWLPKAKNILKRFINNQRPGGWRPRNLIDATLWRKEELQARVRCNAALRKLCVIDSMITEELNLHKAPTSGKK